MSSNTPGKRGYDAPLNAIAALQRADHPARAAGICNLHQAAAQSLFKLLHIYLGMQQPPQSEQNG